MENMKTESIACRACDSETREMQGCSRCGGYGIVLVKKSCASCQTPVWFSPGATTVFEGKKIRSFEGLEMLWQDGRLVCHICAVLNHLDVVPTPTL